MTEVSFKNGDSYASFTLEECSQFSLDDDEVESTNNVNRKHGDKAENEPLNNRRPSTSQHNSNVQQRVNENNRTPSSWTQEKKRNSKEVSRLTDEVELDGSSDSDDLDLLPPISTSNSKTSERKRKLKRFLHCCAPYYVRPKCTIM